MEDDVYWTFTEPHCGVASNNNGNVDHVETYNGGTPAYPQFIVFLQYFGYDNANRLSSAQESNVSGHMGPYPVDWSRNFNYDQYGNMWVTNASGINPAGNTPSAQSNYQASTNQFISALASYDAAGNQLTANGNQVTYDAENRQTVVQSGSSIIGTYNYDGEGNRVTRTTAAGTTVYVYDAANQLAAEYSTSAAIAAPCKTCYFHRDHLGSVRLVTDSGGNVIARHDFLPFGEEIPAGTPAGVTGRTDSTWAASDDVNQKFTGKERDQESGLDFFGARFYGSALGRFTSPDRYNPMLIQQGLETGGLPSAAAASTLNGFLEEPQNWNQYAYVRNNPLRFTDPTGAAPVEGHHLITGRQVLTSPLAQEFTNAIKTGPLSGNGFPNQPGFNSMHRAYNSAVEEVLQNIEQTGGDRNSWSVSQWKNAASQILNSEEPAIKDFLEELESNNPGARAAISGAIAAYRVSAFVALRVGAAVAAEDLLNFLRTPLFIMVDPAVTNPGMFKEDPKKSHRDCLIDRETGNCAI